MKDMNEFFLKEERERLAAILNADKTVLEAFESAYKTEALGKENPITTDGNFFNLNSRDMSKIVKELHANVEGAEKDNVASKKPTKKLVADIVRELMEATSVMTYDRGKNISITQPRLPADVPAVTNADLNAIAEGMRPQLTGSLMKVDMGMKSYPILLSLYKDYLTSKDKAKGLVAYNHFRSGLDFLDLDAVTYEMLGMNKNSMGYWLPAISAAADKHGFFKIPNTKVVKVPMPILQLTRLDYESLTPTTLRIVDDWAMEAFGLDLDKTYFIKTGIYSSKYDFRNVKVTGATEVRTLGEYLLFIHHQTCMMASPMTQPTIYGAATTNEWVVREFIEDAENNPCIYKGMPLHTEYRVFVDFDTKEILGISPYWEPKIMKDHFAKYYETSVHMIHDYQTYNAHEPLLMKRYNANVEQVKQHILELLPDVKLKGQWSIDIMQNGDDFWLIDMALAANSALRECVPVSKLHSGLDQSWIPSGLLGRLLEGKGTKDNGHSED